MKTKSMFLFGFILLGFSSFAQLSGNKVMDRGNSVYNYQPYYAPTPEQPQLFLTDSTFLVKANILMNVKADTLVAVFAVHERAATIRDCNEKINVRIENFTAELAKMGINSKNIYVDLTTQTKLIDYKVDRPNNYAEQYIKGFELNKNVIIRFSNSADIDRLLMAAALYGIYDIVKVDYIVTNMEKVYAQLYKIAGEVINTKKTAYIALTSMKLSPAAQIYSENFRTYYPANLYKKYAPDQSVTTLQTDYNSKMVIKELNSAQTFYYDQLDYSGYDKIINPVVIEPMVEFILNLQVKYKIEKK